MVQWRMVVAQRLLVPVVGVVMRPVVGVVMRRAAVVLLMPAAVVMLAAVAMLAVVVVVTTKLHKQKCGGDSEKCSRRVLWLGLLLAVI
jgi:hypothetical protein